MRIRVSTIAVATAAILSGSALMWTSQQVQIEEARLENVTEAVTTEKETLRVLAAEWSYLNRPLRLEALAEKYLDMSAPEAAQLLASPDPLPELVVPVLPSRKPQSAIIPAVASGSSLSTSTSSSSSSSPLLSSSLSSALSSASSSSSSAPRAAGTPSSSSELKASPSIEAEKSFEALLQTFAGEAP